MSSLALNLVSGLTMGDGRWATACPSYDLVCLPAKGIRRYKVFSYFPNEVFSSEEPCGGKMIRTRYVSTEFYGGFLSSMLAFQGSKKFAKEDFVCSPTFMRINEEVNKTPHFRRVELNSADVRRFCNN